MSRKSKSKDTSEQGAAARTGAEISGLVAAAFDENGKMRTELARVARDRNTAIRYVIVLEQQAANLAGILADVLRHPAIVAAKAAGEISDDLALDLERGTKALAGRGLTELLSLSGRAELLGDALGRVFPEALNGGADALARKLAGDDWQDVALILRAALRRAEARAQTERAGLIYDGAGGILGVRSPKE